MKTATISKKDIKRKWYLIDLKGKVLGRAASSAAIILQGKQKPDFSRNLDTGDYVILINAKEIKLSGNKSEYKTYFSHSTYPGGAKVLDFNRAMEKDPTFPIIHSIRGMLPKNTRGRQMIKKLHVYADENHPHQAQKPEVIKL